MTETKLSQAADIFEGVLFIMCYVFMCILLPASLIVGLAFLIYFI